MSSTRNKASKIFNLYNDYPQKKINLLYKKNTKQLRNIISSLQKDRNLNNKKLRSLVRLSGTEPLVRILVEGENKIIVDQTANKIVTIVRPYLV